MAYVDLLSASWGAVAWSDIDLWSFAFAVLGKLVASGTTRTSIGGLEPPSRTREGTALRSLARGPYGGVNPQGAS